MTEDKSRQQSGNTATLEDKDYDWTTADSNQATLKFGE